MTDLQQPKVQIRLALPTRAVGEHASIPLWVANVTELRHELELRGAKRLLRIYFDPIGDGHTEGTWFSLSELCDEHFAWLSGKGFDVRELAYDTK